MTAAYLNHFVTITYVPPLDGKKAETFSPGWVDVEVHPQLLDHTLGNCAPVDHAGGIRGCNEWVVVRFGCT